MNTILTPSESHRISWFAEMIGVESKDAIGTVCQIKSSLLADTGLLGRMTAQFDAGLDVKGARALVVMVKGALGGAVARWSVS